VIGAAATIMIATINEDFGTFGIGVTDDAATKVRIAY
jgi:hypothetical protein